ncbi:MAG: amidohydrolase family protein [Armatimonadia bacterium]
MTLIDTNAYLGHWATRRLRHNTPDALLALMDRAGIESAWVSSASAIMYRNSHAGNEELWESLQTASSDRLVPFAVINPAYAAWEKDLTWCAETLGARGLRLYPTYHQYKLTDACCHALVDAATALNMVISVPQRVEDYRQRHWLIDAPDVNLNEFAALTAAHGQARFLVTNALGVGGSDFVKKQADLPANYWVDICRPDAVYTQDALALIDALGADRIVFGSGIPFNYPEPALVRMEALEKQGYDIAAIGAGNARRLLVP